MKREDSPDYSDPINRRNPRRWEVSLMLIYWPMWRNLKPWDIRISIRHAFIQIWAYEIRLYTGEWGKFK